MLNRRSKYAIQFFVIIIAVAILMSSAHAIEINVNEVTTEDSENSVTIDYTVTGDPNEGFVANMYVSGESDVQRSRDGTIDSEGGDVTGTRTIYLEPDKSGNFDVYADVSSDDDDGTDTSSTTTVSFTEIDTEDSSLELCDDDVRIGGNVSMVFTIFSVLGPVFGGLFFVGMTVADSARMEAKYQDDRRKVLLYGFSVPVSIGFLRVIGGFLIDADISCYFPGGL